MPQSLSKVYLHIIFHIKTSSPRIQDADLERVHSYIGHLVKDDGCFPIKVGGICDHVHVVCALSKNECVAHLVEEIKRNSSRWIKGLSLHYTNFEWQGGYAAFSVSQSVIDNTVRYVATQKEHHAKQSFEDEYKTFLKLYGIEYDEKYVLSD